MEARRVAFEEAYQSLHKRISAFLALPLETLSRDEIVAAARRIHDEA
jgi:arsenate reductase